MGSVMEKKIKRRLHVLTEEKLDNNGAGMEHSSLKSLARLAQQAKVSISSVRTATKLLKLFPYRITCTFIATMRHSYEDMILKHVYPISE
jgi:L-lysine 2,3-aminomutase